MLCLAPGFKNWSIFLLVALYSLYSLSIQSHNLNKFFAALVTEGYGLKLSR